VIRALIAAASPVVASGPGGAPGQERLARHRRRDVRDTLADDIETHEPQVVLLAVEPRADASPNVVTAGSRCRPDAVARTPAVRTVGRCAYGHLDRGCAASGRASVLPRDATPDEIIAALEAAAVGPRDAACRARGGFRVRDSRPRRRRMAQSATQPLTRRELEVLGMLAEGLANKNIAARLGISEHTVKTHVASILSKLDAFFAGRGRGDRRASGAHPAVTVGGGAASPALALVSATMLRTRWLAHSTDRVWSVAGITGLGLRAQTQPALFDVTASPTDGTSRGRGRGRFAWIRPGSSSERPSARHGDGAASLQPRR
jgi:DNA-binding NarL/FixJ family response regulator